MAGMIMWWIGYWPGMTEWWWNEMNSRTKGFALVQKYPFISPHSVIPSSFWNDETAWNEGKCTRMTSEWYLSIVIFIPCHSRHFQMTKEWRNEEKWGCFWRGRKKWIQRCLSFCHHSIIQVSFRKKLILPFQIELNLEWGMMLKWQECPLNDLIWCCLFKETAAY